MNTRMLGMLVTLALTSPAMAQQDNLDTALRVPGGVWLEGVRNGVGPAWDALGRGCGVEVRLGTGEWHQDPATVFRCPTLKLERPDTWSLLFLDDQDYCQTFYSRWTAQRPTWRVCFGDDWEFRIEKNVSGFLPVWTPIWTLR